MQKEVLEKAEKFLNEFNKSSDEMTQDELENELQKLNDLYDNFFLKDDENVKRDFNERVEEIHRLLETFEANDLSENSDRGYEMEVDRSTYNL